VENSEADDVFREVDETVRVTLAGVSQLTETMYRRRLERDRALGIGVGRAGGDQEAGQSRALSVAASDEVHDRMADEVRAAWPAEQAEAVVNGPAFGATAYWLDQLEREGRPPAQVLSDLGPASVSDPDVRHPAALLAWKLERLTASHTDDGERSDARAGLTGLPVQGRATEGLVGLPRRDRRGTDVMDAVDDLSAARVMAQESATPVAAPVEAPAAALARVRAAREQQLAGLPADAQTAARESDPSFPVPVEQAIRPTGPGHTIVKPAGVQVSQPLDHGR
jgi:hypothetical protein